SGSPTIPGSPPAYAPCGNKRSTRSDPCNRSCRSTVRYIDPSMTQACLGAKHIFWSDPKRLPSLEVCVLLPREGPFFATQSAKKRTPLFAQPPCLRGLNPI